VRIAKDTVVSIDYTIRNGDGAVLDSSQGRQPLVYLHGYRQIVPGVEDAIEGLESGSAVDLWIGPEQAYGDRDPSAVLVLPRTAFPEDETLETGSMFRAFRPDGRPIIFSVIEVTGDMVVVDANHPLAGQTLQVQVEVIAVRDSTAEERAHHHVHEEEAAPPPATTE
jgi:FKBP-type peptidyl-prolyl cis-trans isomerase SlyD